MKHIGVDMKTAQIESEEREACKGVTAWAVGYHGERKAVPALYGSEE